MWLLGSSSKFLMPGNTKAYKHHHGLCALSFMTAAHGHPLRTVSARSAELHYHGSVAAAYTCSLDKLEPCDLDIL